MTEHVRLLESFASYAQPVLTMLDLEEPERASARLQNFPARLHDARATDCECQRTTIESLA
jgi:hypothetical protein